MKFIVYSKESCPHCYQVKTALELCGLDSTVYELGEDYTNEEFYDKFGNGSTFPQVLCDNELLGGAKETILYLKSKSLT
jgi:glutaredoxin